jgi:hypothetical protein
MNPGSIVAAPAPLGPATQLAYNNYYYPAGTSYVGGSGGAAVAGNSFINWVVTGTRYGTIA